MDAKHSSARRFADATLAAVVVSMVAMMILPLPTLLLDVLIATNISIAVLMLLVSMYISGGLQFTAFPTVLLVTTLYRLALNVSSTRLILLNADAGEVIAAFGNFVVQGNYVVGAVVFLILTLIQFLVIAKGSERVAEVGARFTLDAMPGKQMSIDAELRSGGISQDEAREKRRLLQRESQFYGAMDGAMKFVKGDAIASIVITVINIVGGLAIGIAMRDMSAADALRTFGLLTIGDGLVSQIPSLLISTSAGLVVTRVASESKNASLGSEVARQIFGNPKALAIAAAFLLLLGAVPGLPMFPFFTIAAIFGWTAFRLGLAERRRTSLAPQASEVDPLGDAQHTPQVPLVVPVAIDLGTSLDDRILEAGGRKRLDTAISKTREQAFIELGIHVPSVRVRISETMAPDAFLISVQEVPVCGGALVAGHHLAHTSVQELAQLGMQGRAITDLPLPGSGVWIASDIVPPVEAEGILVWDAHEVVGYGLLDAVRKRAADLVGLQETQSMLDQLERAYPALVRNVVPKPISLPSLADILRRLVEEGISIRPLREILEALAVHAPNERDPVALTELVRIALRRQITHQHASQGVLPVFMIDPAIEETIRDAIQRTASGSFLALAPELAHDMIARIRQTCAESAERPLLLTQSDVRRFLRRLIEVELPDAAVLSYQEISPDATVQPLGRVTM